MAGIFDNLKNVVRTAGVAAEGVGNPQFFTQERDRNEILRQRDLKTLITLAGNAQPGTPEYEAITDEIINHPALPDTFRARMQEIKQTRNAGSALPSNVTITDPSILSGTGATTSTPKAAWNWVDPAVARGTYEAERAKQVAAMTPTMVNLNTEKANTEKSKQAEKVSSAGRYDALGGKYGAEGQAATTRAESDRMLKMSQVGKENSYADLNAKKSELAAAQTGLANAKTDTERATMQGKVDKLAGEVSNLEKTGTLIEARTDVQKALAEQKKTGRKFDIKALNEYAYTVTHGKDGKPVEPSEADIFALKEMAKNAGYDIDVSYADNTWPRKNTVNVKIKPASSSNQNDPLGIR